MLKLYSKFPNSSKLIIKIPKLIKLKNNIRGNKKKIRIYDIGLSWVKWVPKKNYQTQPKAQNKILTQPTNTSPKHQVGLD